MMTTVLGELLMSAVEVYLDDFIVFGRDEEEFIINLRATFDAFIKAGITLNPKKCRFGMSEVEYVGHKIDASGISFERKKLDSILDMPKPSKKGEMKTFLGMVNHLHTHIQGLSQISEPLVRLIGEGYTKSKKNHRLEWNADANAAFELVKTRVDECPKLWFEDTSLPVYVQTDASKYGMGAYMFQLTPEGVQRPIEFISKTFSESQRKWDIPDKEAYAIYYAFKRWEHHLRDRHFILQTDHKNLTYLNYEGTTKVRRWKMMMQEFDFDFQYLKGEDNPVADSFSRNCSLEDYYVSDLKQLEIENDFLLYMDAEQETDELFVVTEETPIPDDIRAHIMKVHNALAGHKGVRATEFRLRKAGVTFPDRRGWIERFIKECPFCQKQSYKTTMKGTMPFTLAQTEVMQRLDIDLIGPIDADAEGYCYVLTVIDSFTRWVMAYPMRTAESLEILRNLIQHFGIFGVPREIKTDQGSNLKSRQMEEVLELLETRHTLTVAYSHQENGQVERMNREVIRYLRGICYDRNSSDHWSELLPFAQRICNAEVVSSTGLSAAHILFGAALDLDRSIFTKNVLVESHDHADLSEYSNKLIAAQRAAIEFAQLMQRDKDAAHSAKGQGVDVTEFGIGSLVTLTYPQNLSGKSKPPKKLMTQRKGPMLVVGYKDRTYQVQDLDDKTITPVDVSRLEAFRYDVAHVDPLAEAAKDRQEYVVAEILDHRPRTQPAKHKKTLEFLVRWKGYGPESDSWALWHNNLCYNSICHAYCMSHGMKSMVHRRYRRAGDDDEEED
jgi:cleavage and polyadenylation specificity factor subunit 1